jgi:hypothetical protein
MWLLPLLLLAPALAGSQVREIRLKAPLVSLPEEFGYIRAVRELSDGRVLITDNSSSSRLVVADLAAGRVRELGRVGNGPGEYQNPPDRLLALPDDSTLLTSGSRPPRWVILHRDQVIESVPMDSRAFLAASNAIGADANGNVLANRVIGTTKYDGPYTLQVNAAVRSNRRTGRVDTVATLRGDEMSNRQTGTAARPFMISTQANYSVPEQAILFPDGWIAITRLAPYRVDWIAPDGKVTVGPDLGWKPVKVDDREKRAYTVRLSKQFGRPLDHSRSPWAAFVPPIGVKLPIASPDGSVVIPRSQWSGMEDVRYDVVDRKGTLLGQIVMADNERIVGFGKDGVYVAVADEDGIERLRKHPWAALVKLPG